MMLSSVISRVSAAGFTPASASTAVTLPGRSASSRFRAEMFTAMLMSMPRVRHAAAWRSPLSSTKSVRGRMRPVLSASGMNSSGSSSPWRGWCHRTSASAPITSPVPTDIFGW